MFEGSVEITLLVAEDLLVWEEGLYAWHSREVLVVGSLQVARHL
jgi:hypothetical protein